MRTRFRAQLLKWTLRQVRRLDRRQPDPAELGTSAICRILAISCTAIGDTLMSTPALHSLRQAYPNAHIALLVNPAYVSLFVNNPDVNELIPYAGRWKGFLRMALLLRRRNFDVSAILHGNEPQATPLAYLSGARWRFKLPNSNEYRFLLSNAEPVQTWADFDHGIDQRLAVAKLAGGLPVDGRLVLPLVPATTASLNQRLADRWGIAEAGPVIGFQVGASTSSRRWSPESYAELARRLLLLNPGLHIVITGSPAERKLAEGIAKQVDSARVAVTAGEVPLSEMPALLRRTSMLVTPDTGIMHMAVAVGTPVVALFAAADHRSSGPRQDLERHTIIQKWRTCDPCLSRRCPYAAPLCMENIHVDEVEAACRRYLTQESVL